MAKAVRNVNRKVGWIRVGAAKLLKWIAIVTIVLSSVTQSRTAAAQSATAQPSTVHVDVTPGHVINSFDPDSALGSSIDVLSHDGIDKVYTSAHHPGIFVGGMGTNLLSQQ